VLPPEVGVMVTVPVYVPGARPCATEVLICTVTAVGGAPVRPACSQFPPLVGFAVRVTEVPAGMVSEELCAGGALLLPTVY
jgi:hypothetical protein